MSEVPLYGLGLMAGLRVGPRKYFRRSSESQQDEYFVCCLNHVGFGVKASTGGADPATSESQLGTHFRSSCESQPGEYFRRCLKDAGFGVREST